MLFKDFNVTPAINGFLVRWKWCIDSDNPSVMPSTNLFYVRVNENEIIRESLFEEYDIINFVVRREHIADKNNPAEGILHYHQARARKPQEEGIIHSEFKRGGMGDAQVMIEVPQGFMYVVCLYDSLSNAEWKTATSGTVETYQAPVTEKKILFRSGARSLQFGADRNAESGRQILRITKDSYGNDIYSLVPRDEENLFVEDSIPSEYKYLISLIH